MLTYCLSSDKNRQFVRQACTRMPTKKEKGDAHQEKMQSENTYTEAILSSMGNDQTNNVIMPCLREYSKVLFSYYKKFKEAFYHNV